MIRVIVDDSTATHCGRAGSETTTLPLSYHDNSGASPRAHPPIVFPSNTTSEELKKAIKENLAVNAPLSRLLQSLGLTVFLSVGFC